MTIADGKAPTPQGAKSPAALEARPGGVVARWTTEIDLASKTERDWRKECEAIWKLYRGGGEAGSAATGTHHRSAFPILWSNTETLRPALLNSPPKPDVRRRYRDEDPLGKAVSDVVERSLEFCTDTGGLYHAVKASTLDMCLVGRGVVRVRYSVVTQPIEKGEQAPGEQTEQPQGEPGQEQPQLAQDQAGGGENKSFDGMGVEDAEVAEQTQGVVDGSQPGPIPERIIGEGVEFEHVNWDEFRRGPGQSWNKVWWVAFRHRFDYEELKELVGDKKTADGTAVVDVIPLDSVGKKSDKNQITGQEESAYQAAEVWEVWDKRRRQVVWICEGYKEDALRTDPDPLRLRDFFPTPCPSYLIEDSDSLIPVPVYRMYREQARELEAVTKRIDKITDALKIRGIFHPGLPELEQLLDAGDNEMLPVTNTSTLAQMKSLDDAIWIMPVEKLSAVLQNLYTARQQIINVIYQVTGISDIMRGDTKASETLGAQEIKSQWGTVRLQRGQEEVALFAAHLICLASEVICNRFKLPTLKAMTGLQMPMNADLQQAQQTMQQFQQMQQQAGQAAQAAGQPPGPPPPAIQQAVQKAQEILKKPISWEMVLQVMHSDMLMQYKTDVESDSTVAMTLNNDLQGMQQVLSGVSQFITAYAPLLQQKILPMSAFKEIIMAICRRARLGRAVEDAFDQIGQQEQTNPTQDELAQVQQAHEQLVKSGAQVGKANEAKEQQLHATDQTVMQTMQGMQKMQQEFAQVMRQAVQEMGRLSDTAQSGPQIANALTGLNQRIEQFKAALTQAATTQNFGSQNAPSSESSQAMPTSQPQPAEPKPKEEKKHGISGGGQTKMDHGAIAGRIGEAHGIKE